MQTIIIGTGIAGYTLAKEIRKLDKTTPITMITADGGDFYYKPQLSNALAKYDDPSSLITATAEKMSEDLNLNLLTHTCVEKIDTQNNLVILANQKIPYTKLVLAIGATPIKALLNNQESKHIISVNNLPDYFIFRETIRNKSHVTILGAGLVGCEFADDLVNAGYRVDIIAPSLTPLDTLTPTTVGEKLQDLMTQKGVIWYLGQTATDISKSSHGYTITLSNGKQLETECILSAIGIQPNIGLAQKSGINTRKGILVNEYLQTNVENIFALGDCAEVNGMILPYIAPILHCARSLAKQLLDEHTPVHYPPMPVIIKTPTLPIAALTPHQATEGTWEITTDGNHMSALLYDGEKLKGFVLTGDRVKERVALLKEIEKKP